VTRGDREAYEGDPGYGFTSVLTRRKLGPGCGCAAIRLAIPFGKTSPQGVTFIYEKGGEKRLKKRVPELRRIGGSRGGASVFNNPYSGRAT